MRYSESIEYAAEDSDGAEDVAQVSKMLVSPASVYSVGHEHTPHHLAWYQSQYNAFQHRLDACNDSLCLPGRLTLSMEDI